MDEQLAAIYGTGQTEAYDDEDLQKTAAAEMLVKLAEEEGVSLDEFSDEEIAGMINDLYQEGGEQQVSEEPAEEEKVAEADFLGRVMAHSMVQELNEIEKEAGAKWDAVKGGASKAWGAVKGVAGKAVEQAKGLHEGAVGAKQALTGKSYGRKLTPEVRKKLRGEAWEAAKPGLKTVGAGAALLGAGETGRRIGRGAKKKEAEVDFDKIAEQRALEMLAEAGYQVEDQGEQEKFAEAVEARAYEMLKEAGYPVEEQTSEEEKVAEAIDIRALQMLEEAGYPVEWNE